MLRKLILAAALVLATVASSPTPAPAIDFICTCQVCAGHPNLGCRDLKAGRFTSCSAWWASYGSHC